MFREDRKFFPKGKTVNFIFMDGGVGDHMATLVAMHYVVQRYKWIRALIWVPDYLLEFARHVLPKNASVNNYTSMQRQYDPNKATKTTKWDEITSPMKIHCLDYAFLKLCDENPDITHKNYLQIDPAKIGLKFLNLPEKYVVITTGFTAEVREFPAVHVNATAKYIKSKGYEIVFLGQKSTATGARHNIVGEFPEEIDYSVGLNLIDKTNLLQAAGVISSAKAIVGVDNGLLHVAGCTQTAIVGGFTTVSPELRMPVRHDVLGWNYYPVTPDEALGCKFCQAKTNFLYGHDYRKCIYKDNLCTSQMTSTKFITQLEKIL